MVNTSAKAVCRRLYPELIPLYQKPVALPQKNEDGTIHFSWQPSYSYQGRTITYNLKVYTDYSMQNLVLEENNIINTSWDSEGKLKKGVYYLMVTAVDSEGNEQLSMERYETMLTDIKGLNVNGLLEFTIE